MTRAFVAHYLFSVKWDNFINNYSVKKIIVNLLDFRNNSMLLNKKSCVSKNIPYKNSNKTDTSWGEKLINIHVQFENKN